MLSISQKTFLNIVGGYSLGNILTPKECYLEKESTLLRLDEWKALEPTGCY